MLLMIFLNFVFVFLYNNSLLTPSSGILEVNCFTEIINLQQLLQEF